MKRKFTICIFYKNDEIHGNTQKISKIYRPTAVLYKEEIHDLHTLQSVEIHKHIQNIQIYRPTAVLYKEEIHDLYIFTT